MDIALPIISLSFIKGAAVQEFSHSTKPRIGSGYEVYA